MTAAEPSAWPAWIHPERATEFLLEAHGPNGVEISVFELLKRVTTGEYAFLAALQWLKNWLFTQSLEALPPIGEGDDCETRTIRRPELPFAAMATEVIGQGEHHRQEFKASLWFDRQRAAKDPDVASRDLKSDRVLTSSLKTICGFLNAEGGVLWIGVSDSGTPIGLSDDLSILGLESFDQLETHVRSLLTSRFLEGTSINSYVSISSVDLDGVEVMRVAVRRRPSLSYVEGTPGPVEFFTRQGNRTVSLKINEFADYVLDRHHCR